MVQNLVNVMYCMWALVVILQPAITCFAAFVHLTDFWTLTHCAVYPPSTASAAPVMKDDIGLTMNTMESAISSISPNRCWGTLANSPFITSESVAFLNNGVAMYPGHIALIRIPFEAYVTASVFVRPTTPCLEALYAQAGV